MTIPNIRLLLLFTVTLGIIYPVTLTLVAWGLFPKSSTGSLVSHKGTLIGSSLIAQKFTSEQYFWPRPSTSDYQPLGSGGSNLSPTSAALKTAVEARKSLFKTQPIPSELLFASGSGLDPHLSLEAALFQAPRIAKARGINLEIVKKLIHEQEISWGFLGTPCVNVLLLNLSLDNL